MTHQIKAAEAHVLSGGFKKDYFDACYRRIEAYARRGSECCSLKHAPDPDTEKELIAKLRDDGYKVYENALLVGWYCPDHPLNKRPSSAPVSKPSEPRESICDAYTARCEVNAHKQDYIARQYHLIWKAAQEGHEWCKLDHSPDKQLEKLICQLLTDDGYEVHEESMIATWL